ncbi:MAG: hypothetical protein M5U19_12270 [Microthrixaceae bacterium]|nr:hypothetical protein [Microthrixaceae bacterium]
MPRAGAVLVHCNTRHTGAELAAMLERCGTTALLASESELARLEGMEVACLSTRVTLEDLDSRGSHRIDGGSSTHERRWAPATGGTRRPPGEPPRR